MKLSFRAYLYISVAALCGLVIFSILAHDSLYYALHFLCTERISVAIVTNLVFTSLLGLSRVFVSIFLGRLRDLEVEQVFDVGRGFLLDTVMFLVLSSPTIDDEEVPTVGILQFVGFIVALKLFHLITQTRVAHFFESGSINGSALSRLLGLMLILLCVDVVAVHQFYSRSDRKASLYLWLFFECVGMMASALANITKFAFHYIDSQMEGGWPGTSASIFFLDVVSDILSLTIFLVFMVVFIISYPSRLPIHMTSDIILVGRALFGKLRSFQRYRKLVKEMTKRFPEATLEELTSADTCIICRDLLHIGARKLPCGHVFHVECLKAWFVQQQSCPTCRANVFQPSTASSETGSEQQRSNTAGDSNAAGTAGTAAPATVAEAAAEPNVVASDTAGIARHTPDDSGHATGSHPTGGTGLNGDGGRSLPCASAPPESTGMPPTSTERQSHFHQLSPNLNSSEPVFLMVTRRPVRDEVAVVAASDQSQSSARTVSGFLRRVVGSIAPSLLTGASGGHVHEPLGIPARISQNGTFFVTRQALGSSRRRVRYRRRLPPDGPSTSQLTAQAAALRESMEKALQLSEFFRQQSLYWLERARASSGEHETTLPFHLLPPLAGPAFPHWNMFSSPFANPAEPTMSTISNINTQPVSSPVTPEEFQSLLPSQST